jgi:hypothetical protein
VQLFRNSKGLVEASVLLESGEVLTGSPTLGKDFEQAPAAAAAAAPAPAPAPAPDPAPAPASHAAADDFTIEDGAATLLCVGNRVLLRDPLTCVCACRADDDDVDLDEIQRLEDAAVREREARRESSGGAYNTTPTGVFSPPTAKKRDSRSAMSRECA